MSEGKERFLLRWSRRKSAAREAVPAGSARGGAGAGPVPATQAPKDLPPVESLSGLASEYRDFLQPRVDEALRQAALKKLFADPHFNTMDGLDVYIDDYTQADPIPEELLAGLEQARRLLFESDVKTVNEAAGEAPQAALEAADDSAVPSAELPQQASATAGGRQREQT